MNQLRANTKSVTDKSSLIAELRIPRRPKWTKEMSGEQLKQLESLSFLSWRKNLAKVEESNPDVMLTPFEKNIEVWKQLWRVVEKSDLVIQIVDGRDPMFFRCVDVEIYTKELNPNKGNFLVINKSDLLSEEIRYLFIYKYIIVFIFIIQLIQKSMERVFQF
jgi:large subunit GTPase 1